MSASPKVLTDTCGVCLETFTERSAIGGCAHNFCFVCIEKWSRTTNLCPMCKAPFTEIRKLSTAVESPASAASTAASRKRKTSDPNVVKVKPRKQQAVYDEDEIRRLQYEPDEDDDEGDAFLIGLELEELGRAIEEYVRDGFVVDDADPVVYEDKATGSDVLVQVPDDDEEEAELSRSDDDDDGDGGILIRRSINMRTGRAQQIVRRTRQSAPRAAASRRTRRRSLEVGDNEADDSSIEIISVSYGRRTRGVVGRNGIFVSP